MQKLGLTTTYEEINGGERDKPMAIDWILPTKNKIHCRNLMNKMMNRWVHKTGDLTE